MGITISIGSGKGGTGKTIIMVNLALLLAKTGRRVLLVDLDLGGADAHIYLGAMQAEKSLTDFLGRKVDRLADIALSLDSYQGVSLIKGTGTKLSTAHLTYQEKLRLLRAIRELDADVILIDGGAGATIHTLDFFLASDIQLLAATPDPSSVLDLYNFVALSAVRKTLASFVAHSELGKMLKQSEFSTINDIMQLAAQFGEDAQRKAKEACRNFLPLLVINRNNASNQLNKNMLRQMIAKYLAIEVPELGDIPEDPHVGEALRCFAPVCDLYPEAPAAQALCKISQKLEQVLTLFEQKRQLHKTC